MRLLEIVVMVLSFIPLMRAEDVCCSEVGCFPSSEPWDRFPDVKCPDWIDPIFGLYRNYSVQNPEFFNRTSLPSTFSPVLRTMFVIHGWNGDYDKQFMHDIKDAVLEKEDVNVILVGWGKGAMEEYPNSASNTRAVGAEVALIIDRFRNATDADDFWCVGWSLGAHTCGLAGMKTYIDRVTAIDPAGPLFEGFDPKTQVNPESAGFVDVIHTDGNGTYDLHYGLMTPVGHADYYPNGGTAQPGCPQYTPPPPPDSAVPNGDIDFFGCSHDVAPILFVESIKNKYCLVAEQKCTDYKNMPGSCRPCEGAECGIMGYYDTPASRGLFYLRTGEEEPYCQQSGTYHLTASSLFAILPLLAMALLHDS